MDTTKSHGFFLASFLVLMLLGDLTEACTCKPLGLRKACCQHDFVMRALFTGVQQDPDSPSYMRINKFSIQPIRIFKGSRGAVNARVLYSPESDSFCGYKHKGPFQEDDYVISGIFHENHLKISLCSFSKPWDQISERQKMNLNGFATKDCSSICAPL
ncbi:metalloproteinase inhibitor 1-like [Crotalus tigris]|uniref:metalloproteinase inhibitor 1-like n=1 Tax=Crotalus tigris TaxID=88082 RepID=UPI00192FA892|nr:metalloproteinase inhibitor 1-like [Crotalus tigris]